jgi:hypothetical protein
MNPRPWQHAIDYAVMFGGPLLFYNVPAETRGSWVATAFVGGLIVTGMTSYIVSDVVMLLNKRLDNLRDARMFAQPTEEEKTMGQSFVRKVITDTVVTEGNVRTAVEKAPEAVKKVPAGFVAYQNTAEVVGLREVDRAINMICRRNWTLIDNPDLGFPQGDFREVTWVKTKKMTRKSLLLAIAILERHNGIERAGDNGNSTWVVKDPEVIKRGAREPLKHPIGCYCADCKQL